MNVSVLPQPIPYQGSKRRIAGQILRQLPERMSRLVEPFAGSAAVSLAAAARGQAQKFWINDANEPLVELWRAIINGPHELAEEYSTLWHDQQGREREFFDEVRDRFNGQHQPADLLYLLARCVKAAVRYNAQGQFNNTPDNRRRGARPQEMRRRILLVASLLHKHTRLTAWDYADVLKKCDANTDVIYMDPPYQGVSHGRDSRYFLQFDHDEFCDQLRQITHRNMLFAVSYDGRSGETTYGEPLPESLGLTRLEIDAGRSSQATLLGRRCQTVESLYLSPALLKAAKLTRTPEMQPAQG